jgi:cystathionine beta-lyase
LKAYLAENIRYTREFLALELPKIKVTETESTYLIWMDFSEYGLTQEELDRRMTLGARLWLDSGTMFGEEGKGFQRLNIACPRATLVEALERMKKEFK